MKILVINAGSSSLKCCLYDVLAMGDKPALSLWEASIDWMHQPGVAEIKVETDGAKTAEGAFLREAIALDGKTQSRPYIVSRMLQMIWHGPTRVIDGPSMVDMIGHRVVHGGQTYVEPVRITAEVKAEIGRLSTLAPVHNPANLEGIEVAEHLFGDKTPQIAVFDTAFHSQMPAFAAVYAGPYDWVAMGIRRYGFHGISHHYCAQQVAQLMQRELTELRLITCHLGNGCSLAAIQNGHSIDTTMGFTPLDGLMMGTRAGSVDPGILIHLMRQFGYDAERLDHELNKQSGLLGVSGVSSDMRLVLAAMQAGDERATLAFDMYIHRICAGVGAMLMRLGQLDALVFTAGVGENAPLVRERVCHALAFLGVKMDPVKNQNHPLDADIASGDSSARVYVIHTQEDWAIAQACWRYGV